MVTETNFTFKVNIGDCSLWFYYILVNGIHFKFYQYELFKLQLAVMYQ